MKIGIIKVFIHVPHVHSLKEKRMIVKSLCAKVHNKFNVSIIEAKDQDKHQSVVLALSFVAGSSSQADSIIDNVINFIEENCSGEIVGIERELL